MSFRKAIIGIVLNLFLQPRFACNMCQCFLKDLLDLVTLDYMLLIMVYIVYQYVYVGGAAVFDPAGQLSELALCQHLFCILYQRIIQ